MKESHDKRKNYKIITLIFFSFISTLVLSQTIKKNNNDSTSSLITSKNDVIETRHLLKRKGNFYFYWGYPKAYFTQSNIRFYDDYYDFTITNITATDDKDKHDFTTYIKPGSFTIPMYNWRLGYFINNKTFITFGQDHMKYSMDKQVTLLTGHIDKGKFKGTYNNTMIMVGDDSKETVTHTNQMDSLPNEFVAEFEHCDGLNDFGFEIGRLEQFWISKNSKHALSVQGTFGMGMMIPDSEVELLQLEERHNNGKGRKSFHLAGYSFSASIGAQFDFFKHFFVLGKLKTGFINLPDIYTSLEGGRASQHFYFLEPMLVVGYTHSFNKKNKQ